MSFDPTSPDSRWIKVYSDSKLVFTVWTTVDKYWEVRDFYYVKDQEKARARFQRPDYIPEDAKCFKRFSYQLEETGNTKAVDEYFFASGSPQVQKVGDHSFDLDSLLESEGLDKV